MCVYIYVCVCMHITYVNYYLVYTLSSYIYETYYYFYKQCHNKYNN